MEVVRSKRCGGLVVRGSKQEHHVKDAGGGRWG
jgi:hypothetical protein